MWPGRMRLRVSWRTVLGPPFPTALVGFWPGYADQLWPRDRSWFVWTDWDLKGTRLSGSRALGGAARADAVLETVDWLED